MSINDSSLKFNIAHSDNVYMIAVARGFEVGIDVECIDRKIGNVQNLAARWLHAVEVERVGSSAKKFLEAWIQKEAYVKGLGLGLSKGYLQEFFIDKDGRVVDAKDCRDWKIVKFSISCKDRTSAGLSAAGLTQWSGCVAMEGRDSHVDAWWTYGDVF